MAGKIRFYRGSSGTELPPIQNGGIFVVERPGVDKNNSQYGLGDIYVDIDNARRLHIVPDSDFVIFDDSMTNQKSVLGEVYIVVRDKLDPITGEPVLDEHGDVVQIQAGVRIGDGLAYVGDLPLYDADVYSTVQNIVNTVDDISNTVDDISNTVQNKIVHTKIDAYLGNEYLALTSEQKAADIGYTTERSLDEYINSSNAAETLVLTKELWL